MHTDTSGGCTDTEVNELAANPTGRPSRRAHTAVTPDGKHPYACRNRAGSTAVGSISIILSALHVGGRSLAGEVVRCGAAMSSAAP
ncbi:hypothetical protein PSA01_67390 [Pseudonocardia saturnea]|uniref:Uncharacterized protein n=1 Tax=Pseudonocardia saturnea TaxID=33909 RepID=A0ABQ0S9W4_9PSEU|nr:hypothetical protein Pdca_66990 [Pseudonocardia autotrophica]GEC29710.1 hypothetical protein PSA01_67390 [Pseudonocardia saturnea]